MGWLRDLMARSTPPVASLGELARLALAHRDWPNDTRIQPRSLATLFSKLDREQELDWLRDRPRAQEVISAILRLPLLDLKSKLGEKSEALDVRRLRLRDVRFARELDLGREELPPGFPKELFDRAEWSPRIWIAESGAGRGLFAAFLTARGLAQVRTCSQTTELRKLPTRGPLFLDLEPDVELDEAALEELRASHRPVCIAAQRHQIHASLPVASFIVSPPATDYLGALIDWVRERLAPDSILDPDRAETWIQRQLTRGATFGDVLGMIGLCDELPHKELTRLGLEGALALHLERRLMEVTSGQAAPARLASVALDALTEAAAKTLVEAGRALPSGLTVDAWSRLLESRAAELSDPVWLESALLGVELSARDLRRITTNLPPSGHRLVRALIAASILHPETRADTGPELCVLAPHCLRGVLRKRAASEVLRMAPSEWGQALLRQTSVKAKDPTSVQAALEEQAMLGSFPAHEELIESFDELSPEHGAAIEWALESLGATLLRGHPVPDELARETIVSFARVGVFLDGIGEPRFRPRAAFFARFLALLEHHAVLPGALDPLRAEHPSARIAMRHAIVSSLEAGQEEELEGPIWALLFRLSLSATSVDPGVDHPVLEFLRNASVGRPTPASLALLENKNWNVLVQALGALDISAQTLSVDLWSMLRTLPPAECLAWLERFAPRSGPEAENLWRNMPDGFLESLEESPLLPFELLLPHQLAALTERSRARLSAALAAHCPLTSVLARASRLGLDGFSAEAVKTLVLRFPIAFGRVCLGRAIDHHEPAGFDGVRASRMLHAIQDELPETPVAVALPAPVRDALRRALLEEVRTPSSESSRQSAYRRLTELDRALWPLLKASSSIRAAPSPPSGRTQPPT